MESKSQSTEVRSRDDEFVPGAIVTIYADPITELQREGEAKLLKCTDRDFGVYNGVQLERWQVEFLADGFITDRTIKTAKVL